MPTYLKYTYIYKFSFRIWVGSGAGSEMFFSAEPDTDPDPWKIMLDPHPRIQLIHLKNEDNDMHF